jgi:hypothetical protein
MQRDKQQQTDEYANQRIVPERVNLNEYAGDAEDEQLACQQANEYIKDCDRKLNAQTGREENRSNDR